MTADELRDRVKAAGGRGTWEYYRADDAGMTVTIIADYDGKTWTARRQVAWLDLALRRGAGASSFESEDMAREREGLARSMKLPRSTPAP